MFTIDTRGLHSWMRDLATVEAGGKAMPLCKLRLPPPLTVATLAIVFGERGFLAELKLDVEGEHCKLEPTSILRAVESCVPGQWKRLPEKPVAYFVDEKTQRPRVRMEVLKEAVQLVLGAWTAEEVRLSLYENRGSSTTLGHLILNSRQGEPRRLTTVTGTDVPNPRIEWLPYDDFNAFAESMRDLERMANSVAEILVNRAPYSPLTASFQARDVNTVLSNAWSDRLY